MLQKEKFLPFISFIEDLIQIEIFQFYDINGFFEFIMMTMMETNHVEHLQLFLDHLVKSPLESKRQQYFQKYLRVNSQFLLNACMHEQMDMVKVFLKHQCHLTTRPENEENMDWTTIPNPMGFDDLPLEDRKNLKILKMMASKSYIFGCYQAMLETKSFQNCICDQLSVVTLRSNRQSKARFLESIRSRKHIPQQCPAEEDFVPNFLDCTLHVECNDPISR